MPPSEGQTRNFRLSFKKWPDGSADPVSTAAKLRHPMISAFAYVAANSLQSPSWHPPT